MPQLSSQSLLLIPLPHVTSEILGDSWRDLKVLDGLG